MTASSGTLAARLVADTANFRAEMTNAANISERELKRAAGAARFVNDYLKETAKLTKVAGESSAGIQESAKAMEGFGFHTAGAKRELLVLAHELSQGNYSRFGGSLLVLGERTGAAALLFSGMGLAALGATAVLGGFAAAAFKGAQESESLRKALVLTGNFAGITEGQFNAMARSLSTETGASIGNTRKALQALVATGEIGPRVLGPLAGAVTLYAKATGETEETVAKDFAKMGDGVAKFADEHNKSLHFLTLAQHDYIKTLEEQGKKEEAEIALLDALAHHHSGVMKPSLGYLESAIKSAGRAWDSFWDSAKGAGRSESVDEKIAAAKKALDEIGRNGLRGRVHPDSDIASRGRTYGDQRESARRFIADLEKQKKGAEDAAAASAKLAETEQKRINAVNARDKWREELNGVSQVNKEIEKYRKLTVEPLVGTPDAISAKEQAAAEAEIRRKYSSHADRAGESEAKKLANSIKERLQLYAEESARLKEQEDEYAKYGKIIDKSAEAVARIDISTGKYAKALPALKSAILDAARAEDVQAAKTKGAEEFARKAAEEAKKREEAAIALRKHLEDAAIATQIEIEKLDEETKFLGLNTAERRIAIEQLKIEKEARTLLADPKNAGHEDEINDNAAKRKAAIADAIKKNDAAQKSFSYGADEAFKKYQQDAYDAAKFAGQYIDGSLSRMEDALMNFVKTGKLSFSDLFSFMAEEYIRQQIKMSIADFTPGGKGSGGSSLLASAISIGSSFFGSHAQGLDYVPYDGYLARLHEGEKVQTKQAAAAGRSGSGGGNVVDASIGTLNVGQGVSRAEMAAAFAQHRKYIDGRVQRLQLNGRLA